MEVIFIHGTLPPMSAEDRSLLSKVKRVFFLAFCHQRPYTADNMNVRYILPGKNYRLCNSGLLLRLEEQSRIPRTSVWNLVPSEDTRGCAGGPW